MNSPLTAVYAQFIQTLFHTFAILFPIYLYYIFIFSFLESLLSFHQCRGKNKKKKKKENLLKSNEKES